MSVPHPLAFSEALRSDPDQRERSGYIRLFQVEGKAEEVLLRDDDTDTTNGTATGEPAGGGSDEDVRAR